MNFGRECSWGGGPPGGGWNPGKPRPRNSRKKMPSKFAEKSAGNFPKIRQAKIKKSPQIRSAEPRHQRHGDWEPSKPCVCELLKVIPRNAMPGMGLRGCFVLPVTTSHRWAAMSMACPVPNSMDVAKFWMWNAWRSMKTCVMNALRNLLNSDKQGLLTCDSGKPNKSRIQSEGPTNLAMGQDPCACKAPECLEPSFLTHDHRHWISGSLWIDGALNGGKNSANGNNASFLWMVCL